MFNSMAKRARQVFRSLATISLVSVMATAMVLADPASATSAETEAPTPTPTVEPAPVPTPTISDPPVPTANPIPTTTPTAPDVSPTAVWYGNAASFGYDMSNLPAGAKTVISWDRSGFGQFSITTNNWWWSGTQNGWTNASVKVYSSTGELLYASPPVRNPADSPTTAPTTTAPTPVPTTTAPTTVPTPVPTTTAPTTPVPTTTVPITPAPTPVPIPPSPVVTVPPVVTTPVPIPPFVIPPSHEVTDKPNIPTPVPTNPASTTGSDNSNNGNNPKPTPVKPVVEKPVVKMVTRHFQVDTYMPRTKSQARVVANLVKDEKLRYREDRALWGASKWKFVSVRVPTNATKAQVMKAVSSKAGRKFASLSTTAKLKNIKPGQRVTIAWELGKGAKPVLGKAWGPKNKTVQVYLGRSK